MKVKHIYMFLLMIFMALSSGCIKRSKFVENNKNINGADSQTTKLDELDFNVENKTGGTIYVTCFSYIQKKPFSRWRWDKSPVYKLETDQTAKIDIDTIHDKLVRDNVYGYLAIFSSQDKANESTFELLDENNKIDLDRIHKLKNKKVIVSIERYGFKGVSLDYKTESINKADRLKLKTAELDFAVQNNTGKTIWLTCFLYQQKDGSLIWGYDKAPIQKVEPNQIAIIDVDTITKKDVIMDIYGYLAIFNENEEKEAKDSVYELLDPYKMIYLNKIIALKNKKVILEIEKYGVDDDFIDYTIQPLRLK